MMFTMSRLGTLPIVVCLDPKRANFYYFNGQPVNIIILMLYIRVCTYKQQGVGIEIGSGTCSRRQLGCVLCVPRSGMGLCVHETAIHTTALSILGTTSLPLSTQTGMCLLPYIGKFLLLKALCHNIRATCYYFKKHLKSTTNHDKYGRHARASVTVLCDTPRPQLLTDRAKCTVLWQVSPETKAKHHKET